MVEVFKTNVDDNNQATFLLAEIHENFGSYKANFDLDDCDRILRVESNGESVNPFVVINLLKDYGFSAEILPDTLPNEQSLRDIGLLVQ